MSRRTTILRPGGADTLERHDGTSQRDRALPALNPGYAVIDERGNADLLKFVQAFADKLKYFDADEERDGVHEDGTWQHFVTHPETEVSLADMVAYVAEPERFTGERARWLGRPHFALLLTFVELLGHARTQLNGLTQRHLDYYYREILRMQPEPAQPDRAAVVFRLANRAAQLRLPAGTALEAGRDSNGVPRIYRTERELYLNRAEVAELRSVFVHRKITGIPDVRKDRSQTAREAFDATLRIALGDPRPGDPVPKWEDSDIDLKFLTGFRQPIDFARKHLYLEHHELRALMGLVRRRTGPESENEWTEIKRRIDAEWAEINRLLERAGRRQRRQRGRLSWRLDPAADPTAFDQNLAQALEGRWPSPWPSGTGTIEAYEDRIRRLEIHLSMPVERIERLVAFAEKLGESSAAEHFDWREIDRILAEAHRERIYAGRRSELAEARADRDNLEGFDAVVAFVLGKALGWDLLARPQLAQHLDEGQLALLDGFRQQLDDPSAPRRFTWSDVYRVLELARRYVEGMPEPVAREIEWRNLYAAENARAQLVDAAGSARWKTFGRPPVADDASPLAPTMGWALSSPLLALEKGTRTIRPTLVFAAESFDRTSFLRGIGLDETELKQKLKASLADAWVAEVSTAKGWVVLDIDEASLESDVNKPPSLQIKLVADATHDPIVPPPGADQPMLRITLRQHWDGKEWTTRFAPFEPLRLAAVQLAVEVEGLTELHLQHDERVLDPRKPFEPFGREPAVGSRLYLSHPELVRKRLDELRFELEWMGLPASLADHYCNYPVVSDGVTGQTASLNGSFWVRMALVDRNLEIGLPNDAPLFEDESQDKSQDHPTTRSRCSLEIAPASALESSGFKYRARPELAPGDDLRAQSRYWLWELAPRDFGHGIYPSLAAEKARALAVGLAKGTVTEANQADYQVNAPYTPKIKRLSVSYRSSTAIYPSAPADAHRLLHVHPFGTAPIDKDDPRFLPRYDQAGELYIGLRGLQPPQHLTLLMQLAEGTSDPDLDPAPVSWSCLDGDRWQPVDLLHDSTRGLINSGIVALDLPDVAPSTRLPSGLYWLRVAIPHSPASVCDTVDIRAQAAMTGFDDQGNAADHYEQPLPAGSVDRLLEPDGRIAAVEQPFTSFGGKPPERAELLHTRVSERLRHKHRALGPWDYERLVLQRFSQIYKVKCLSASATGETGRVDLIVIPDIKAAEPRDVLAPKAPTNLLADIQAYLSERMPAAARIQVRNAHYLPVRVRLGVRFVPGVDASFAKTKLNAELIRFLSPWAYDEGAELTIGGKIYANSILDFVDRRDYVDYVAEIKLFRGRDGGFNSLQSQPDDQVATDQPDQVLVSARRHDIDVISELDYQQSSFTGIGYMKLELDFIVG